MSKLRDTFVKFLQLLKMVFLLNDIYWAKKLIVNSINAQDVRFDQKSGHLFLKQLNIRIAKGQNLFLLKGYYFAVSLVEVSGAKFYVNEQNDVFVNVDNLKVNIRGHEDIFILKELYVDGIYNILLSDPVVMWDIGMNVGLASIYFANKQDVVVVGYEPFKDTFNQALGNISLNPMLSNRIRAFNMGISDSNGEVYAEYNQEVANMLGVSSPPEYYKEGLDFELEKIELRDVRQVLDSIVADYPNRTIIAKIDCEGSEYQIINALATAGKLHLLKVIMMEWHRRKPEDNPFTLVSALNAFGFKVFLFRPNSKNIGMLYAVYGNNNGVEQ